MVMLYFQAIPLDLIDASMSSELIEWADNFYDLQVSLFFVFSDILPIQLDDSIKIWAIRIPIWQVYSYLIFRNVVYLVPNRLG